MNTRADKHTITVVVPQGAALHALLQNRCEVIPLPLLNFRKTRSPLTMFMYLVNLLRMSVSMSRIVFKKDIDIILANSLKANLYGSLLKLITGRKLICFIRDTVTSPYASWLLKAVDCKVCVSKYIYDQIPGSVQNKRIIHPGIETSVKHKRWHNLRKELGIDPHMSIIGTIGQFTPWKNQIAFVRLAERVLQQNTNVHFVLCGSCLSETDRKYKQQLQHQVQQSVISNHTTFLDFRDDVDTVFRSLDMVVHCASEEPFGRVVAEAMAYEKPVVAFRAGGICEIVRHGKTGYLCETGDIADMAAKCLLLINHPELSHALGVAGGKRFREKFSLQKHMDQLQTILQ